MSFYGCTVSYVPDDIYVRKPYITPYPYIYYPYLYSPHYYVVPPKPNIYYHNPSPGIHYGPRGGGRHR